MPGTLAGRLLNGQPFLITAAVVQSGSTYSDRVDEFYTATSLTTSTLISQGGSSSTASLAETSTVIDRKRVFSRDATTGTPGNFTTPYNKGYASVTFSINPSAASGLWIALYDADSNGAVANTPGTGTQLQAPIVAATHVNTGSQTINIDIPAGPQFYYADLALNPSMTNALRISHPFGVGHVTFATGQSLTTVWFDGYPNGGQNLQTLATYIPQNVMYAPGFAPNWTTVPAKGTATWEMAQTDSTVPGSYYVTTFPPEFLWLLRNKLGVVTALVGTAFNGAPIDLWDPYSDTTFYRNLLPSTLDLMQHIDNSFDYLIWDEGGGSQNITSGEYQARFVSVAQALTSPCTKPLYFTASNLQMFYHAPTPGGAPGEPVLGPQYQTRPDRGMKRVLAGMSNGHWFNQVAAFFTQDGAHPTMGSRVLIAREYYRAYLLQAGLTTPGPNFTGAATRASGTKAIRLAVQQNGGNALTTIAHDASNAIVPATSPHLAQLFNVYPAGNVLDTQRMALDATTPVQIIDKNTIQLNLANTPNDTDAFDVWFSWNYTSDGGGATATIRDDVTDGEPFNYGHILQTPIDPIYVPPPTAATRTITINTIAGLSSSAVTLTNAVTVATGVFTGIPPTGIDFSTDGTTFVAGNALVINNGGTWRAAFTSPSAAQGFTLTARLAGTSVTNTKSFTTVASDFPLTGAKFDLDPRKVDHFYTDTARTQLYSGDTTLIKGISDVTGNGNHLYSPNVGQPFVFDANNGLPALMFSAGNGNDLRYGSLVPMPGIGQAGSPHAGGMQTIPGATLPTQLWNASFTLFAVMRLTQGLAVGGMVFTAEPNWNGPENKQSLALVAFETEVGAIRNCNVPLGDTPNLVVQDQSPTRTPYNAIPDNSANLRKYVMRFDVSSGTLKLKGDGAAEVTATHAGDFSVGTQWQLCGIGISQMINGYPGGDPQQLYGTILRIVVIPGHYATDAERDAILAYGETLYGSTE